MVAKALFFDPFEGALDLTKWTNPCGPQRLEFLPTGGVDNNGGLRFYTGSRGNRDVAIFYAQYADAPPHCMAQADRPNNRYKMVRDPLAGKKKFTVQTDVRFLPAGQIWPGLIFKSAITTIRSTDNGTRVHFNGYTFLVSPKAKTKLPWNAWLVRTGQNNCEECREGEAWLKGASVDIPDEGWVRLRVEVDGLTFKCYVNDVMVIQHTDVKSYAENQTMVGLVGRRNKEEAPDAVDWTTDKYMQLYEQGKLTGDAYVVGHSHDYVFDNFVVTEGSVPNLPALK